MMIIFTNLFDISSTFFYNSIFLNVNFFVKSLLNIYCFKNASNSNSRDISEKNIRLYTRHDYYSANTKFTFGIHIFRKFYSKCCMISKEHETIINYNKKEVQIIEGKSGTGP